MNELFETGKSALTNQAFSALLGAELEVFEAGTAVLSLPIREDLKQQHGFVHGGVISYLADNALTFAGGSVKINYLRPALGRKLAARATVVSSGRNQAVCHCTVIAKGEADESIVAVAQGTINRVVSKDLSE